MRGAAIACAGAVGFGPLVVMAVLLRDVPGAARFRDCCDNALLAQLGTEYILLGIVAVVGLACLWGATRRSDLRRRGNAAVGGGVSCLVLLGVVSQVLAI